MKRTTLLMVGCFCLLVAGCYNRAPPKYEKGDVLCVDALGIKFIVGHVLRYSDGDYYRGHAESGKVVAFHQDVVLRCN